MELIGPYRLDALVGRGTAGSVWRATRQGAVAQVVAIKRARTSRRADVVDRLRQEATILADLDHPHIVRVLDVLPDRADVAIVMSYARGGSLHDLLAERGRLTPGQTVAVASRVADALGSAHRSGVLHGDVKPANILFTTDGEPLLGDFGVAQHLTGRRAGSEGDGDGAGGLRAIEGTTGYVDPELVATGRPEPRNDLYGLAVVAYACLTGRTPHEGDTARAVLAAADVGDHPPLHDDPSVPRPLADVVEAALARDPARRPASAEAMARSLRAAVDPATVVLPGTASTLVEPEPSLVVVADDDDDADAAGGADGADSSDAGAEDDRAHPATPDGAHGGALDGRSGPVGDRGRPPSPERGTRVFGPRPPAPDGHGDRGRPLVTGLVVAVLLVGAAGAGLWLRARLDERQASAEVAVDARGAPSGEACPALPRLTLPPGGQALEADLRGDGCPVPMVWDGAVLQLYLDPDDERPRRYAFDSDEGGSGHLVFGDWDCDGVDSPALYQPTTGRLSSFSYVPERAEAEVESVRVDDTGIVDGRPSVVEGGGSGDCDRVEVSPSA